MGDNIDALFEELNTPLSASATNEELQNVIRKARDAETKTKVQVYTLRGKKALSMIQEEEEAQSSSASLSRDPSAAALPPGGSNNEFDLLRRQIEEMRAEERKLQEDIAALRRAKQEREMARAQQHAAPVVPQVASQSSFTVPQMQPASSFTVPQVVEQPRVVAPQVYEAPRVAAPQIIEPKVQPMQAPPPTSIAPAAPSANPAKVERAPSVDVSSSFLSNSAVAKGSPQSTPPRAEMTSSTSSTSSSSSKSSKSSKKSGKSGLSKPSSMTIQTLNISWDSGSKSKKNNKVYTIQVSMNGVIWKIVRGDEILADFAKKVKAMKAETVPFPSLAKKSIKSDQQGELSAAISQYLTAINLDIIFKKDKYKQLYLKFFAPLSPRDEGMGNFPGNASEVENWYVWKLDPQ